MSAVHLAAIGTDSKLQSRLIEVAREFQFKVSFYIGSEEYAEKIEKDGTPLVSFFSAGLLPNAADVCGHLQVIKYAAAEAYTILAVGVKVPSEDLAFIKKSGADLIVEEPDIFETSFLEFVLSQLIRGALVPLKGHELANDSVVDFKVLTVLPLNQKILPALFPSERIKDSKYDKLKNSKELYFDRDDLAKVQEYIRQNQKHSAEGLASRCRLNYLNLCKAHADLVIGLFDQTGQVTFSSGKLLLEKCETLASEMLTNLSNLEDPWTIINNSTLGETGSVERSPAVAAMAGLMTLNLPGVNTKETILAGLLCDIGMLCLHPSILRKIRDNKIEELSSDERAQFINHPLRSVEKCLTKKLPLDEKTKAIMMATHERFDNKGFPQKTIASQIPKESQLLQYCEFIDQKLLIKMGEKNIRSSKVQLSVLEAELMDKKILDVSLVYELRKFLQIIETTESVKAVT